jgi:hypothetical protein
MMKIAFRVIFIFKMVADKIGKISMFSNCNEHWYLGLFWSEELIGIDENCIQGHFYDATVSKMAASKIVKLSVVSDWYLGVFWSEKLVGNDENCIHIPESDMRVVWGLLCLHPNTIKPRYYYYSPFFLSVAHEHVQGKSQELLYSFVVKGFKVIFWWVQRGWGLL